MKSPLKFLKYLTLSVLVFSTILALCGAREAVSQGYVWPSWRGPDGNGISKESAWDPNALSGGPKILWKADVGEGHSSVIIKGNRLYTMGKKSVKKRLNNVVCCLGADTGKRIWEYKFESIDETLSTPVLDDTSVYVLSKKGILSCLDTKNGKLRWKKDLVAEYGAVQPYFGFAGSPVIAGELLILTVNTAGMGLNKKTGEMVWSSEPPPKRIKASDPSSSTGADYSTPVIYEHNGKQYALIASWKGISSVDVETGQPLWVYEWELYSGRHVTDPVVIGKRIYVADDFAGYQSPGSLLLEITNEEPSVLWKSLDLNTEISNPVIIDGYVYSGQSGPYKYYASLRCIDLETGKMLWDKKVSEASMPGCVSLMAADGKLVILTDDGMLRIAEAVPDGYTEISGCDVYNGDKDKNRRFWTPPVLCNGKIYCRNYYSDLVCIDVRKSQ